MATAKEKRQNTVVFILLLLFGFMAKKLKGNEGEDEDMDDTLYNDNPASENEPIKNIRENDEETHLGVPNMVDESLIKYSRDYENYASKKDSRECCC